MTEEVEIESGALLVDTSIFDGNGLRLEKGLLNKLSQFKKSPIRKIDFGTIEPDYSAYD